MNKNLLVKIQSQIRGRKDTLRKALLSGEDKNENIEKIIFPRNVYTPKNYTNTDQWYFNGFLIKLEDQLIVVDPGVDFYSRFTSTEYSFSNITGIIVTHSHIDHSASLALFLEKILKYKNDSFRLFISQNTFDFEVPGYLRDQLLKAENKHKVVLLTDDDKKIIKHHFGNYFVQFQPLYHNCPDTFGFKIIKNEICIIGHISDTGYAKEIKSSSGVEMPDSMLGDFLEITSAHDYIKDFFEDCVSLVINVNDLNYNRHSKYHLSAWDVLDICKDSKVKKIILQHLASINTDGEDSNYLYKLFFYDQKYETLLPSYSERIINL